jgi:predicted GIY-YIG superfamily endonuclease
MKSGYIYIISNPAHPGFLKFGITEDIKSRLGTYQTGDPKRAYQIEYYILHPDYKTAERKIKEMLKYFAKSQRNEWAEISLPIAISRVDETLDDYNNDPENY